MPGLRIPEWMNQPGDPANREGESAAVDSSEGPLDVLSILSASLASWVEYRGARQQRFLGEHGICHGWTLRTTRGDLAKEIRHRSPQVVLNETWIADPGVIRDLATEFPEVRFVSLTHGVPAAMASHRPRDHYKCLRAARDLPNCYYGHVMPESRLIAPTGVKAVSLPNLIEIPEGLPSRAKDAPFTVSLIGRSDFLKGWGSTVGAIVEASRYADLQVIVSAPNERNGLIHHLDFFDDCGVSWTRTPWRGWQDYLAMVAQYVDVGLCGSWVESLCLIPLEHCLLGRPVVTTAAVEWVPSEWQVNGQDPREMAACLLDHKKHYAKRSRQAQKLAERLRKDSNRSLIKNLTALLDS